MTILIILSLFDYKIINNIKKKKNDFGKKNIALKLEVNMLLRINAKAIIIIY